MSEKPPVLPVNFFDEKPPVLPVDFFEKKKPGFTNPRKGGFLNRLAEDLRKIQKPSVPFVESPVLARKRAAEIQNAKPRKPLTTANMISEVNEATAQLGQNIRSIPGVRVAENIAADMPMNPTRFIRPSDAIAGVATAPLHASVDVARFLDTGEMEALGNVALELGIPGIGKVAKPVAKKVVELFKRGKRADAAKVLKSAPKFDMSGLSQKMKSGEVAEQNYVNRHIDNRVSRGIPQEAAEAQLRTEFRNSGLGETLNNRGGAKPQVSEDLKAPRGTSTGNVEANRFKETGEPSGLSRASRAIHADLYGTDKPTTIKGKTLDELYEGGKKQVEEGFDFEGEMSELAKAGRPASDEQIGIFSAGRDKLLGDLKRLNGKLDKGDTSVLSERDELFEKIADFDRNLDEVKGAGGRSLKALQIGQTVNWGDLDEVLIEARRVKGSQISSGSVKQFRELTEKQVKADERITTLETQLAEVKAGGIVEKAKRGPRFDKADLDKELSELFEQGKKKLSSTNLGAGLGGLDPELFTIAGKIALNYAKRGVNSLDEIVSNVQEVWKAQFGQEIDRQTVIDAMGSPQTASKTKSELQSQITSLRAQAKREGTANKAKIQTDITDLQAQLETGNFRIPSKRELQVSKELEGLRAEKALYQGKVQAGIRQLAVPVGKKVAKEIAGGIRGTILGSDIGVLTRQGLFGLSRPVEFAKGVGAGLKSAVSEKALAQIEKRILDHDVAGLKSGVAYKKAGLSLTDHLTNPEELVVGKLLRRIPGISQLGGSLERFQSAFINTLRSETFDRAIKLGYKENELAARANFINSATGRSNIKGVPTALEVILTSPRYEASRWEMLAQPIRNAALIGKDAVTKKGLNRGAIANLQDMAVTAGEIYGLYKLAETAGYEVNFDPTSSDFLKMRKGEEVWDPSAGIAPRLRDVMRMVAWGMEPNYKDNVAKVLSAGVTRPISPAIKQPIEALSQQVQLARGIPEDKLASFFSGWKIDEDEKGLITFAPLVIQTVKKYLDQGDTSGAIFAGAREFAGQSVSRYPKPAK